MIFSRQDFSHCAISNSFAIDFASSKRTARSFCIMAIMSLNVSSCCRRVLFSSAAQSVFNLASHDLICVAVTDLASTLNASYSFFREKTISSRQDISDWFVTSCRLHLVVLRWCSRRSSFTVALCLVLSSAILPVSCSHRSTKDSEDSSLSMRSLTSCLATSNLASTSSLSLPSCLHWSAIDSASDLEDSILHLKSSDSC
mmetsp:Transcript_34460/g.63341  ORF Transcript_34460/g.63341 Transcript_34460/m.63341 type:complete len:200 (+) Transcript_34460:677-1276(+)